jgi:(p)ppGpp synthase/HD superfamily hydrolase
MLPRRKMTKTDHPLLGKRFEEAFLFANRLHAEQKRKASGAPYLSHLLSVAALVLQDGGDEDEAVAALLHDAAEDQGGEETLETIRERFGEKVASIVVDCSDTFETPKPPWKGRKEAYIARIQNFSPQSIRVIQADKLHNARALLRELRNQGEVIWDSFNGKKEGTLWYNRTLHNILGETNQGYLWLEFGRVLEQIEQLAK